MALDSTVGGSAANSYVSVDEADAYFTNRLYSDNWPTFIYKENALILSTSMIDWYINWIGVRTSSEQALDWPRTNAVIPSGETVDPTIVPNSVKVAVYELTLAMIESDVTQDWELQGFKNVKAGPLELEIDGSSDNPTPNSMPQRIYKILSDLTSSGNVKGSVSVVRLVRA